MMKGTVSDNYSTARHDGVGGGATQARRATYPRLVEQHDDLDIEARAHTRSSCPGFDQESMLV